MDHCYPDPAANATSKAQLANAKTAVGTAVPQPDAPWRRKQVRRDLVPPSQVSVQDVESARAAIVLIIAGIMIFWRFVLRVLLATIVVAAGLGLFVLLQNMHR